MRMKLYIVIVCLIYIYIGGRSKDHQLSPSAQGRSDPQRSSNNILAHLLNPQDSWEIPKLGLEGENLSNWMVNFPASHLWLPGCRLDARCRLVAQNVHCPWFFHVQLLCLCLLRSHCWAWPCTSIVSPICLHPYLVHIKYHGLLRIMKTTSKST